MRLKKKENLPIPTSKTRKRLMNKHQAEAVFKNRLPGMEISAQEDSHGITIRTRSMVLGADYRIAPEFGDAHMLDLNAHRLATQIQDEVMTQFGLHDRLRDAEARSEDFGHRKGYREGYYAGLWAPRGEYEIAKKAQEDISALIERLGDEAVARIEGMYR
jgi:hypothetical protein